MIKHIYVVDKELPIPEDGFKGYHLIIEDEHDTISRGDFERKVGRALNRVLRLI